MSARSRLLILLIGIILFVLFKSCNGSTIQIDEGPISFFVSGDYPYAENELAILLNHIELINGSSIEGEFFLHLGDITRYEGCFEQRYIGVANAVKTLNIPGFVLVGDNEWIDCPKWNNSATIEQGWAWYDKYLSNLDEFFEYPWDLKRQEIRNENWAFVYKGVLFIGLNMPGGAYINVMDRFYDNNEWVLQQLNNPDVRAAVVFGHSGPHSGLNDYFFDLFEIAVENFDRPVLYIQGDLHVWQEDHPFANEKITRLIVKRGGEEQPVQVTVTMDPINPWEFKRNPFSSVNE